MATDGTSLESIENGEVANTADANRMQAILRDMNSSAEAPRNAGQMLPMAPHPQMQDMQPMPSRQPMPPMLQMSSHQAQANVQRPPQVQYVPVAEEGPAEPKKNVWSSILEQIRDPLFVVLLFFLLSLPVFHTFVGKYATWAFAIGGQLSWLGLGSLAVVAGLIFALFRTVCSLAGF